MSREQQLEAALRAAIRFGHPLATCGCKQCKDARDLVKEPDELFFASIGKLSPCGACQEWPNVCLQCRTAFKVWLESKEQAAGAKP